MSDKVFKLPHGSIPVAAVKDPGLKKILMQLNENLVAAEKAIREVQSRKG